GRVPPLPAGTPRSAASRDAGARDRRATGPPPWARGGR
ncbi:MAG: hypothetical protein AVDCRST_MAG59-2664, partial [uncultured Thermomicrobiales bacterium]